MNKRQRQAQTVLQDLQQLLLKHHKRGKGLDSIELVGFAGGFLKMFLAKLHGPEAAQRFLEDLAAQSVSTAKVGNEEALRAWFEAVEPMGRS